MSSMETTQSYIAQDRFYKYFLPIFLLGWVGNSLRFLSPIFNNNTRWLLLGMLMLILMTKRNLVRLFDAPLAFLLFVYGGWCFLTSFWSSIELYSLIKSSLFIIFIPTLICAGILWVKTYSIYNSLHYLGLLGFFTVMSSPFGHHSLQAGNYYVGLANGANALGFILSVSFPFFLWMAYHRWYQKGERWFWVICNLLIFQYLFWTMSRSSIVIVISVLLLFFMSLNANKKSKILLGSLLVMVTLLLYNSAFILKIVDIGSHYVYKSGGVGSFNSIIMSRSTPWQLSYHGAQEGGWTGLGFGNSWTQDNLGSTMSLTMLGHLREKGNSQLAIVEETGLIGLIIYCSLLFYLIIKFAKLYSTIKNQDLKILMAIILGTLLGLLFQSVFEGWWYAPCSPEFIYFWLFIGISRGIELSLFQTNHVSKSCND